MKSRMPLIVTALVVAVGVIAAYTIFASGGSKRTSAPATSPAATSTAKTTGNGAPNGAHHTLNVIGVAKGKTGDFSGGSRLFVPLEGNCRIDLSPGPFAVLDGNCTDNTAAAFQLPNPDPDGDGETAYTVWARPLGKPGGTAKATTCATDPTTGEEVCSIESNTFVRNKGKSSFGDVSKGFLSVTVYLDGSTTPTTLSIFDERLQDYFWSYDNNGLKNLQLRFYQR